jgi:ABC-type dipeptide/oligopeptide/nickel transport system permease subunit
MSAVQLTETLLPRRSLLRRFVRDRMAVAAVCWIALVVAAGVLAPWIAPYDPDQVGLLNRLQPPSAEHWLGTDELGRDVFSRLLYAGRVSMLAALFTVLVSVCIGLPTGVIAAYAGGAWDYTLGRINDAVMSVPPLILALGIVTALGPGLYTAMFGVGIVYSPRIFRIARGSVLTVKEETYIEASVAIGGSPSRVLWRHAFPNALSPILVQISLMGGFALLAEASLSFLGVGVQSPQASWGLMLGRAFRELNRNPEMILYPGIVIALTALSFNLIGDAIRDSIGAQRRPTT